MKIFATSDTHFGHDKLVEYGVRPEGFSELILRRYKGFHGDMLIHCGDFCIGNDLEWHEEFLERNRDMFNSRVLVLGNHDHKSKSWYMRVGWDMVCDEMTLKIFGKSIVFSHKPIEKREGVDINFHGHLHGKGVLSHRKVKGLDPTFHVDLAPEIRKYSPVDIGREIEKHFPQKLDIPELPKEDDNLL